MDELKNNYTYADNNPVSEMLPRSSHKDFRKIFGKIRGYAIILVCIVAFSMIISKLVLFNAYIPSDSMKPGLWQGTRLFGYRQAYLFSKPERGDVVIFEHRCYYNKSAETLIKRIIGLPGETILIKDGRLMVDGRVLEEEYIEEDMLGDYGPYVVPEHSFFMLGDNRNVSDDSRIWDYPFVDLDDIKAKAWLKYIPRIEIIR